MTEYDDPIVRKLKAAAPFPIDVECAGYPDVIFHVILNEKATPHHTEICVNALMLYMHEYDKWHFLKPIHYVSDVDSLPVAPSVFSICVHVDFGSAGPKGLLGAVKAIAATELPIYRLVLE